MEFCPKCNFMVYTKLDKSQDIPSLSHYCKNCGWENVIQDTKGPVYQRNYEEDHIADKALSNKYTIFDVTLPRVQYDCVNPKCATIVDNESEKSFTISNIPADLTDEEFQNLFSDVQDKIADTPKRVKLTSAIVKCNTIGDKNTLKDIFNQKIIDEQKITTSDYKKPEKEVLYIKYDPMNMKYLYLCAVCGTSWKKT